MSRKNDEIVPVRVTPKKNQVYSVKALREQEKEEALDEAIEAEGKRIEAEENQRAAEQEKRERDRKRQLEDEEREERAQKKAKKAVDEVYYQITSNIFAHLLKIN